MNHELDLPDGARLADYLDNWLRKIPQERIVSDLDRQKIEELFEDYLLNIKALGIVKGVLFGSSSLERKGYIWNIFQQDFQLEDFSDPRFGELNLLGYRFEKDMVSLLPLRISHVNPSNLRRLIDQCEEKNINVEVEFF